MRLITVWCCYYSNMDLWLLTHVVLELKHLRLLFSMIEVRVIGTQSTCLTCSPLLLLNSLRMTPWYQNM